MIALTIQYFQKNTCKADIVLSDFISEYESVKEGLRKTKLFDNVYEFPIRDCYKDRRKNAIAFKCRQIYCELKGCCKKEIAQVVDNGYDEVFFTNSHCYINTLILKLKKKNSELVVNIVDEGYSTYTNMRKNELFGFNQGRNFLRAVHEFFCKEQHLSDIISNMYLMDKDLLCWEVPYNVISIPSVDIDNEQDFKEKINMTFSYKYAVDEYEEKHIFFEESFHVDNNQSDDLDLLELITKEVGKENMVIKLHPRSLCDRFSDKGYKVIKKSGGPWEVVAANMRIDEGKVLVTISSGAIVNTFLLFNKAFSSLFLYKCSEVNWVKWEESVERFFEKFFEKYNRKVYVPENKEELVKLLKRL